MPALTSLQPAAPAASSCALVVGSTPLGAHLRNLLLSSHWNFEQTSDIEHAADRLSNGDVPVVLCGANGWREVVAGASRMSHPPQVLVFDEKPDDREWRDAIASGACYVDARHLDAPRLFSLLNHAWRVWNRI
jgi:hypothetical protein